MKKLLAIVVLGLFFETNVLAEEIILRCVPKITTVRAGGKQVGLHFGIGYCTQNLKKNLISLKVKSQ